MRTHDAHWLRRVLPPQVFTIYVFGGAMTSIAKRLNVVADKTRNRNTSTLDEPLLEGRGARCVAKWCVKWSAPKVRLN